MKLVTILVTVFYIFPVSEVFAACTGTLCTGIVCPVGSYFCEDRCTLGTCNNNGGNNQVTCKQVTLFGDVDCSNSCVYNNQCDSFSCHPVSNNCDQVACGTWYCEDSCGGKNYGTQCSPGLSCQGQFAGATCVGSQPTPTPIPQETNFWCYKCGVNDCTWQDNNPGDGSGCFEFIAGDGNSETNAISLCDQGSAACPAPTTIPPTNTPMPVATSTPVPTATPTSAPSARTYWYCLSDRYGRPQYGCSSGQYTSAQECSAAVANKALPDTADNYCWPAESQCRQIDGGCPQWVVFPTNTLLPTSTPAVNMCDPKNYPV